MIKVIDIFAGPGGLSEGFSAVKDHQGRSVFNVVLSIEMDKHAFDTLKLRTFFRLTGEPPDDYYRYLRQEITINELYQNHSKIAGEASRKCWHTRLGIKGESTEEVRRRIDSVLTKNDTWILIGGPPCQAYSLAGRSRNSGNPNYNPIEDEKQRLYIEYLQILADHKPIAFIMENVKGLLSATLENQRIFNLILQDLRDPQKALEREGRSRRKGKSYGYHIYSLVEPRKFENGNLQGSVIKAEKYGIPQARHRVILLGVRDDLKNITPKVLKDRQEVTVSAVLDSLPKVRSGLSRKEDSAEAWIKSLRSQEISRWANAGTRKVDSEELSFLIRSYLRNINPPENDRGGEFIKAEISSGYNQDWFCDDKIGGICNHSTRGHMEKDIYRYMYAVCFAQLYKKSPTLNHFPTDLIPDHISADSAIKSGSNFSDRFRVQIYDRPSTTVMSHISKDGHYYIHPDANQCRSLTVREAARLQTFPDNYFFCGPKTAQYIQVGNAVPPMLAKQIGEVVYDVLLQTGAYD